MSPPGLWVCGGSSHPCCDGQDASPRLAGFPSSSHTHGPFINLSSAALFECTLPAYCQDVPWEGAKDFSCPKQKGGEIPAPPMLRTQNLNNVLLLTSASPLSWVPIKKGTDL